MLARRRSANIIVSLTDATTIIFERIDSHNAEVKISWYVVEFEEGVRVQQGIENFNSPCFSPFGHAAQILQLMFF